MPDDQRNDRVDARRYFTEGETAPTVKEIRAAYEKFIPVADRKY
jgi:hypothetical protein